VLVTLRLCTLIPEPEPPRGFFNLKNVRLYAL